MPKFPIAKKDKLEIIEDFLEHLNNSGVVLAEESEDDKGTVELDRFNGVKMLINNFLAQKPVAEIDEDE